MMSKVEPLVSIGKVAEALKVSASTVRNLTDAGVLPSSRTEGQHRRYAMPEVMAAWAKYREAATGAATSPVVTSQPPAAFNMAAGAGLFDGETHVVRHDALAGLDEADVWRDVAPLLDLDGRDRARAVLQYVFTEMLNNAIDHSDGATAIIRVWSTDDVIAVEVSDDGIGVFQRLADGKKLPDLFSSIQELTKGKQTTAPSHHSGEGIFFSSKAVDLFWLDANGIGWTVDNLREDQAVGVSSVTTGTRVRFEVRAETDRDLGELFREFSEDFEFTRTRPVIKLFTIGVTFVSRSEAKRLLVDMDKFREVALDFKGVDSVGQGFVDELFRVWPREHPGTTLTPQNMNEAVEFMVTRGLMAGRQAVDP